MGFSPTTRPRTIKLHKQCLNWLDHWIDGKSATKEIRLLFAPNVGAIPRGDSRRERAIK